MPETSEARASTVRISSATQITLRELAADTGLTMQDIVSEAVELYRRRHILELTNQAYAALRSHPEAWKEESDERAEWDATLADGDDSV